MSHHNISYSQLTVYNNCKYNYYLSYLHKFGIRKPSIYNLFGIALHETLQDYLELSPNDKIKYDYHTILQNKLIVIHNEFKQAFQESFTDIEEVSKFYDYGIPLFEQFLQDESKYIPNDYELVKCEYELNDDIKLIDGITNDNIGFVGYIDILFKNKLYTNKYYIYDIKTSYNGWSDKDKKDETKIAQLILYKYFLSKQLNVDINDIEIYYLIFNLKAQTIDFFKPKYDIKMTNKVFDNIKYFITNVFDDDGNFIDALENYPKTNNIDKCSWCEFKGTPYCNKFNLSI